MGKNRGDRPKRNALENFGWRSWTGILLLVPLVFARPARSQSAIPAPGASGGAAVSSGRLARWVDLQGGNLALDYKKAEPTAEPWYYQLQYRFLLRGLVRIDKRARYTVGFRLSTGNAFTFSWNNTGAGAGDFEKYLNLKELYFSASPSNHLEFQFGGGAISRGESSEITGYSNNGYLMGERIRLRYPERLFFDEISVTGAYLGDPYKPGVFERFHRLGSMNYHQFLVAKKVGERISASADYTFQDGVDTLREAVKVTIDRKPWVDSVVFENYERLNHQSAWGCALWAQKSPTPRLTLAGGYVDIDKDYLNWNSDRMGKGRRLYISGTYSFWREFSLSAYATRAFLNDFPVHTQTRFDVIVIYDLQKAAKRAGFF